MKIKRYFAPNMRLAMVQITDELGSSAVILSSRNSQGGVEVLAAVDFDETVFSNTSIWLSFRMLNG